MKPISLNISFWPGVLALGGVWKPGDNIPDPQMQREGNHFLAPRAALPAHSLAQLSSLAVTCSGVQHCSGDQYGALFSF